MRIDLLFIQLAVVLLPGLIWTQLAATYAMKERPRPAEFVVRAFFFGILTYMVVYFMYGWFGREFFETAGGRFAATPACRFRRRDSVVLRRGARVLFRLDLRVHTQVDDALPELGGSGHDTRKGRHMGTSPSAACRRRSSTCMSGTLKGALHTPAGYVHIPKQGN